MLDKAGRMQLPKHFVSTLAMKDLVRLDLETDHIGVWPAPTPGVADADPEDQP